jgi:hypothetical protein
VNPDLRTILAAALAGALLLATPAAADTLLHADRGARNVTAYGGALMWSRPDAGGRHRLVQRIGGVAADAPVAAADAPFDPDLGPGPGGRPAAVYERCRKGFRRCDVYRLDLRTGKERKVPGAAARGASEFGASVWGGRYAFGREAPRRDGLYTAARGRARFLAPRNVVETDVRDRTIAFATYSAGDGAEVDLTAIWVHRVRARGRGRSCLVDRGHQGADGGTALNSPALDGEHVYWHDFTADPAIVERVARARLGSACSRRPRIQVAGRSLPVGVDSIAADHGTVYYTRGDFVDAPGVYVADSPPLRFLGG